MSALEQVIYFAAMVVAFAALLYRNYGDLR
jgi:hypothetical protein